MEINLDNKRCPLNLEHTLNCGQLFRWKKINDWWYGVVNDHVIKIKQDNKKLIFHFFPEIENKKLIENYLRLDDDLPIILTKINKDENIKRAINSFYGLRLCRQDPWECLISYICATYKSIPAIKKMISNISRCYGNKLTFDGLDFYTFPKPNVLAKITTNNLLDCGLGFRSNRVLHTAELVEQGKLDLDELKKIEYSEAKENLLALPGVGHKVADCILLFSLEKLQAFPIDVWIKRATIRLYSNYFDPLFINQIIEKNSITPKQYEKIASFGREYFGSYAGYAQEYLFHFLRTTSS